MIFMANPFVSTMKDMKNYEERLTFRRKKFLKTGTCQNTPERLQVPYIGIENSVGNINSYTMYSFNRNGTI